MKKNIIFSLILFLSFSFMPEICAKDNANKNIIISNRNFSIVLPYETKGKFEISKKENGIFIYDKASKKAGFGGLAFGIASYKEPSSHAMMPGARKIGELVNKRNISDIVLIQPTDVQYDYVNGSSESYKLLYSIGSSLYDETGEKVSINGKCKNKYFKNQGMKGEDLYKDILEKHVTAIKENWDSIKLEKENMSYMYKVLAESNKNILDKVGYAYYDVNDDGIDELFIGEIADGDWKGVVYDIYTMVNRKPAHVISGGSRNRYFVSNDVFLCNEYSSGAGESGWNIYVLVENSTELYPQMGFKYSEYENSVTPWFISYEITNEDGWKSVSKMTFKDRKATFDRYKRFDYVPLSKIINTVK